MVLKGEVDVVVRALYGGFTVGAQAMVLLGELHTVSESRCILRTHTDHVQRQYGHPNFSPSCAGTAVGAPRRSPRAPTREKGPPRRKEGLLSAHTLQGPLGVASPGSSCPPRPTTSSSPPGSSLLPDEVSCLKIAEHIEGEMKVSRRRTWKNE